MNNKDHTRILADWVHRIEAESQNDPRKYKVLMVALIEYAFDGTENPFLKKWMKSAVDTEEKEKLRTYAEYKKWRAEVLKRDHFTCAVCGQVGGRLDVHHIKPFAEYPEYRIDVNNGITLCKKCHIDIHREKR